MRFADMGTATLRGGRTYSPAAVAQVQWDRERLPSAFALPVPVSPR